MTKPIIFRPWWCTEQTIPVEGDFLRSRAGSTYLVTLSRPIKGEETRRCVHCERLGKNVAIPNGAVCHLLEWARHDSNDWKRTQEIAAASPNLTP